MCRLEAEGEVEVHSGKSSKGSIIELSFDQRKWALASKRKRAKCVQSRRNIVCRAREA